MNWETYYNLPVPYKAWIIKRIEKEMKRSADAGNDIPHKGHHANDPQTRALLGKAHPNAPMKLRRF
jgi:hypothetical protein